MHADTDAPGGHLGDEVVAAEREALVVQPEHVEVPGVPDVGVDRGRLELLHLGEGLRVPLRDEPPALLQRVGTSQLGQSERSLQVGEVVLEAGVRDVVAPGAGALVAPPGVAAHAVQAPLARPVDERPAPGQHAPLPRGDVLRRVEGEAHGVPLDGLVDGAHGRPGPGRAEGVRGVLDHAAARSGGPATGPRSCRTVARRSGPG